MPNLKGAERAFALGVPMVNYVLSASEAHNLANVRRTTEESLPDFARIVAPRDQRRPKRGSAGRRPRHRVRLHDLQARYRRRGWSRSPRGSAELGADEIIVADTVGYARSRTGPPVDGRGDGGGSATFPSPATSTTRAGFGLANVTAALEAGVRGFDASLGGLGGCPFAPGATGNIVTEDIGLPARAAGLRHRRRPRAAGWPCDGKSRAGCRSERFSGAIARAGLPKTYRVPASAAA